MTKDSNHVIGHVPLKLLLLFKELTFLMMINSFKSIKD